MADSEYRYDVAISFLHQDENFALKLHTDLSETLSVFVYSKRQEELAGTDGQESFREVFRSEARLNVVLYRNGWGETRFTRVEELAIKDRAFSGDWRPLLFVTLDGSYPRWLPETNIRLDYSEYKDSLIGAIRLRAAELGSKSKPDTPANRAKRMRAAADADSLRQTKLSMEARTAAPLEWAKLIATVAEQVKQIEDDVYLEMGNTQTFLTVRSNLATAHVSISPLPHDAKIHVQIFAGKLKLPHEQGLFQLPGNEPRRVEEFVFHFDFNASYDWCWRLDSKAEKIFRTVALAEFVVNHVLDIHSGVESGKIRRGSESGPSTRGPHSWMS